MTIGTERNYQRESFSNIENISNLSRRCAFFEDISAPAEAPLYDSTDISNIQYLFDNEIPELALEYTDLNDLPQKVVPLYLKYALKVFDRPDNTSPFTEEPNESTEYAKMLMLQYLDSLKFSVTGDDGDDDLYSRAVCVNEFQLLSTFIEALFKNKEYELAIQGCGKLISKQHSHQSNYFNVDSSIKTAAKIAIKAYHKILTNEEPPKINYGNELQQYYQLTSEYCKYRVENNSYKIEHHLKRRYPLSKAKKSSSPPTSATIPIDIITESTYLNGFNVSIAHTKGQRSEMEDEYIVNSLSNDTCIFGVLDGHNGYEAAHEMKYLYPRKFNTLFEEMKEKNLDTLGIWNALKLSCVATNDSIEENFESGATAVIATVIDDFFYLSNVGDCRAIGILEGTYFQFTQDSDATTEKGHILKRGGTVKGGYILGNTGILQPGRAIGDRSFPEVSCRPNITGFPLPSDNTKLNKLVLASDGIWDVLDSKKVLDYIAKNKKQSDELICQHLVELALHMNSTDNITIMIIDLNSVTPVSMNNDIPK